MTEAESAIAHEKADVVMLRGGKNQKLPRWRLD